MTHTKLGDVADVKISGVDKKTQPGEDTVRLCNYTDIYYNWAITKEMYGGLMVASAKASEINDYSVGKGMVVITKDSETREDIGHSAYVADDFCDVVLGYHCAFVKPHKGELDGSFLNGLLRSSYAAKYFANNAGGSGQRYYLNEDAIKGLPLFLPSFKEQCLIGKFLSSIDRKIALNRKKIEKLEALAKTIYDYWFVQFDFPDANGRPYKSSGGKMVYNPILKREIPDGWHAGTLDDLLKNLKDGTHNPPKRTDKGVVLLTGELFGNMYLDYGKATYISNEDYNAIHSTYRPEEWNVILTKIGTLGKVNYLTRDDLPIAIHCNSALLQFKDEYVGPYSYMLCKSDAFFERMRRKKGQSVQEFVSLGSLASIELDVPLRKCVSGYNRLMLPVFSLFELLRREIGNLATLRDILLPLLMNGQVEVGE